MNGVHLVPLSRLLGGVVVALITLNSLRALALHHLLCLLGLLQILDVCRPDILLVLVLV